MPVCLGGVRSSSQKQGSCGSRRNWKHKHRSSDINFLEALAVSEAIALFAETLQRYGAAELHLVVDNMATKCTIVRGKARAYWLNEALRPALQLLAELQICHTAQYIDTLLNPADSLSRGEDLDMEKCSVVASGLREGERGRQRTLPNPLRNKNVAARFVR